LLLFNRNKFSFKRLKLDLFINILSLFVFYSGCSTFESRKFERGYPVYLNSEWVSAFRADNVRNFSDLTEPKAIVKTLFENSPSDVTVYPSEFYWYFKMPVAGSWVRGSLTWFVESSDKMTLNYYEDNRNFTASGESYKLDPRSFGHDFDLAKDIGCQVGGIEYASDGIIRKVSCFGMSKTFHYPYLNKNKEFNSAKLNKLGSLYEGEEYWGDFIDESGLRFSAIYLPSEKLFIEVLHPDDHKLVRLKHYKSENVYLDSNTDFVFYKDGSRYVMLGVYVYNSIENNMFDGTHDQLPHADMLAGHIEKIGKIIPNLFYSHDLPVTEFGEFKDMSGVNFVIDLHVKYVHIKEFSYVSKCSKDKPQFYRCLFNRISDGEAQKNNQSSKKSGK
jgi:hypothetical protein